MTIKPVYYCHDSHCRKYIPEHEYLTHKRLNHDVEIMDKEHLENTEKEARDEGRMEL